MQTDVDDELIGQAILGVDRARTKLAAWLKKIIDNPEIQQTLDFTLYQVAKHQGEKPVHPFTHDFEQPLEVSVEAFLEAAQEDLRANNFLSKTTYAVRVDGRDERSAFVLEVPVRRGTSDDYRRDYFPDAQGMTAQTMEQNQFLVDKVVEVSGRNEGLLLGLLSRQEAKIERQDRTEAERASQVQKLIDGNLQREMMYEQFRREEDRKDKFADGFKKMGPPLLAGIMGPQAAAALAMAAGGAEGGGGAPLGLGPGGGEPSDEELIDEFVATIEQSPEMLQSVMQLFSGKPRCFALFAELYKRSGGRREAASAQEEHARAERQQRANQSPPQPPRSPPQTPQGQSGNSPYGSPPTTGYHYGSPPPAPGGGFRPNT